MSRSVKRTTRKSTAATCGLFCACMLTPSDPCARLQAAPPQTDTPPAAQAKDATTQRSPVPVWSAEARWYYLEVDRFYNGTRSNDPPNTARWRLGLDPADTRGGGAPAGTAPPDPVNYGGDLQGLTAKIGYLNELAVNAVILDPIFLGTGAAPRTITDPRHIDDTFGIAGSVDELAGETEEPETWKLSNTDRLFLPFVESAHKSGIRVVLSGPFASPANGVAATPLSEKNLLAVTRRWMDPDGDGNPADGIDGWFVPLPANIPDDFWPKWRKQAKQTNPDALLILCDPSGAATPSVRKQFDVEVNSAPAGTIRQLFRKGDKDPDLPKLVQNLREHQQKLSGTQRYAHINMLSDMKGPRLATLLSTPASTDLSAAALYDKPPSDQAISRWRLATILQHFYPGAPLTYYGDEAGMYGLCRPGPRPPMWWLDPPTGGEKPRGFRGDLFGLVRWLHNLRNRYEPLRTGKFKPVLLDEKKRVLAVSRALPGEQVILVMNYGRKKQKVMLPAGEPGQMLGLLSPNITPAPRMRPKSAAQPGAAPNKKNGKDGEASAATDSNTASEPSRADNERPDYTHIRRLRMGGSRQYVNENGKIVVWVSPMSIRVVLIDEDEPWR